MRPARPLRATLLAIGALIMAPILFVAFIATMTRRS